MLDGRVKTLHPAIHGGILARRDDARARAPARQPRHRADRPGGGQPLPLRADGGPAGRRVRGRRRADRRRRAGDDPGGRQEPRRRRRAGGPGPVRPGAGGARRTGGELSAETRRRLAQEAFRRTAQYDAAIAAWLARARSAPAAGRGGRAGALPASAPDRSRARAGAPLRREPPPAGRVLPAPRPGPRPRRRPPAPRPRALVQQPARPVGGARAAPRVRGAGRGRDQAHEPVRRRRRPGRGHGLRAGPGLRPGVDLRRHRGGEPPRGRVAPPGARRHPPRDPVRARLHAGRAGGAAPDEEEAARLRGAGRPAGLAGASRRAAERARGPARPGDRTWRTSSRARARW